MMLQATPTKQDFELVIARLHVGARVVFKWSEAYPADAFAITARSDRQISSPLQAVATYEMSNSKTRKRLGP